MPLDLPPAVDDSVVVGPIAPFASDADYEVCRKLHRQYGTTYYFASRRFPRPVRRRVDALYGFVRVPDEWVDNPDELSLEDRQALLVDWRRQLRQGLEGIAPTHPAMRAFCDVARECRMPIEEPLLFLDAMEMDLTVERYPTYLDLRNYMRGSASAVGVMMCYALGMKEDPETRRAAMALGEAMQLTNFLRDIGEDLERGRVYMPLEDLQTFGLTVDDLFQRRVDDRFIRLVKFESDRARSLYALARTGIPALPKMAQKPVAIAADLYERILDRIVDRGYDVFGGRARTSRAEKLLCAARIALGL